MAWLPEDDLRLRAIGATLLMTMEIAELLGTAQLTGHGVSSIADTPIVLRYVEVEAHLGRALLVLKARGIGHSTGLRRFVIDAHGGAQFKDLRGVLTGLPQPDRAAGRAASPRSPRKKGRE